MALLSLAAFAATHGASKQAAAKWKARGLLTIVDGKIDAEASDVAMRDAGIGRFKSSTAPVHRSKSVDAGIAADVDAAVDDVADTLAAAGLDDQAVAGFVSNLKRGEFATLIMAQQIKENALALKHLIAAQLAAGAVVDIEVAGNVIFEDRRASRDSWMNWPARIGPLLAADLDIDAGKVVEALNGYVHQQLTDLGEPELDFRSGRSG